MRRFRFFIQFCFPTDRDDYAIRAFLALYGHDEICWLTVNLVKFGERGLSLQQKHCRPDMVLVSETSRQEVLLEFPWEGTGWKRPLRGGNPSTKSAVKSTHIF